LGKCGSKAVNQKVKPYAAGESAYVVLDGELDLSRRDEIDEALPAPESISGGVINLAYATYVDSTVLGALVRFRRAFINHGGNPEDLIIVLAKNGPVRRSFEATGLNRLFAIAFVEPAPLPPEEHLTRRS
jgi:anti-anti-sigma factor